MNKKTKNRLLTILFCMFSSIVGIILILHNLEQNITFFYPPSKIPPDLIDKKIRVGGIVKPGSIQKQNLSEIIFVITDNISETKIFYQGVLPALFRENQGIVAEGKLSNDLFIAEELLTKHDENYMPPDMSKK